MRYRSLQKSFAIFSREKSGLKDIESIIHVGHVNIGAFHVNLCNKSTGLVRADHHRRGRFGNIEYLQSIAACAQEDEVPHLCHSSDRGRTLIGTDQAWPQGIRDIHDLQLVRLCRFAHCHKDHIVFRRQLGREFPWHISFENTSPGGMG
jgi:hypothetical protein